MKSRHPREHKSWGPIILILIVTIIGLAIYFAAGIEGLVEWLGR